MAQPRPGWVDIYVTLSQREYVNERPRAELEQLVGAELSAGLDDAALPTRSRKTQKGSRSG